ncbi:MAG: Tubulin/FtsZ family, GTPase domain [Verrucomicrobiota bacterium]
MKVNNIVVVSIGQAGNQIAALFWKTICEEHGIDPLTGQTAQGQEPRGTGARSSRVSARAVAAASSRVP